MQATSSVSDYHLLLFCAFYADFQQKIMILPTFLDYLSYFAVHHSLTSRPLIPGIHIFLLQKRHWKSVICILMIISSTLCNAPTRGKSMTYRTSSWQPLAALWCEERTAKFVPVNTFYVSSALILWFTSIINQLMKTKQYIIRKYQSK